MEQFELAHTRGIVQIDSASYQTSNPRVFAAGDVVFGDGQGEAMVVSAAQQGKLAAYSIYKLLIAAQIRVGVTICVKLRKNLSLCFRCEFCCEEYSRM